MKAEVLVCYLIVGVLWVGALGTLGYLALSARKRKRYRDSHGCALWEIDTGESVWIAAFWRWQAIDWYLKYGDLDPFFDRADVEGCCSREPVSLETLHYRDLSAPSEGKESFRDTMEQHHAEGGRIPFLVSSSCG